MKEDDNPNELPRFGQPLNSDDSDIQPDVLDLEVAAMLGKKLE